MRLLFAGTPEVAVPALAALLQSEHEIVAVLTQPAKARGRSSRPVDSAVAEFANLHGLTVLAPDRVGDVASELAALDLDLAVVVAYGQLVPASLLSIPKRGWVNLHFSLLPKWRGAAPVQHALIAGDFATGATVFQLEAGMDTGPVLGSLEVDVDPAETAGDLLSRLSDSGSALLARVVDEISSGAAVAAPQDHAAASFAPKLTAADAVVDWRKTAAEIDRLIRGCTPAPGAWTTVNGQRLELGPVTIADNELTLSPGSVEATKRSVFVGTGSQALQLGQVKPAGGKWMDAAAWARGWREPIARLGDEI